MFLPLLHMIVPLIALACVTDAMVNNICEAVPVSLLWALNRLIKLPEVCFKFPFILIGKLTMASSTGQSWWIIKSWYTAGVPQHDFRAVSHMDLTRV